MGRGWAYLRIDRLRVTSGDSPLPPPPPRLPLHCVCASGGGEGGGAKEMCGWLGVYCLYFGLPPPPSPTAHAPLAISPPSLLPPSALPTPTTHLRRCAPAAPKQPPYTLPPGPIPAPPLLVTPSILPESPPSTCAAAPPLPSAYNLHAPNQAAQPGPPRQTLDGTSPPPLAALHSSCPP